MNEVLRRELEYRLNEARRILSDAVSEMEDVHKQVAELTRTIEWRAELIAAILIELREDEQRRWPETEPLSFDEVHNGWGQAVADAYARLVAG